MSISTRVLLCSVMPLVSCARSRGVESDELSASTPCKDDGCETNLWPRVIVGIVPPEGSEKDGAELVRARLRLEDGRLLEGHVHGCPDTAPGIRCTYSFFTTPQDRTAVLLLEPVERPAARVEAAIGLGRFNHCGREIAYVPVALSRDLSLRLEPTKLVSPCSEVKRG